MEYILSANTDIGNTKQTNQDSFYGKVLDINGVKYAFAVLCDGMGGLDKGEVASASLVNAFKSWSEEKLPELAVNDANISVEELKQDWTYIVTQMNEKIKLYGKKCAVSLGTTVTAILLTPVRYIVLNVGDSRTYEIGRDISVITKDQTVVAREVEQGLLTEEQAKTDARRSVLLQCVGASDQVYPDFFVGEVQLNSIYMLCSDGFRHEITQEEIYETFRPDKMTELSVMQQANVYLIDLNKQRQETDNISVMTIRTY